MMMDWTKHITDPKEKEEYQTSLKHQRWVLDDLSKILSEIEQRQEYRQIDPKLYDTPNWEYRQAHLNGYRQCLNSIKTLINLDPKDSK